MDVLTSSHTKLCWHFILFLFITTYTGLSLLHPFSCVFSFPSFLYFLLSVQSVTWFLSSLTAVIFYFFSPFYMQDCLLGPCQSFCWPSVFPCLNREKEQETVEPVWSSLLQEAATTLGTNHSVLVIRGYDHTWYTVLFSFKKSR